MDAGILEMFHRPCHYDVAVSASEHTFGDIMPLQRSGNDLRRDVESVSNGLVQG